MAQSERKVTATRQRGPWTLSAVSNLAGADLEYCAVEPAPPNDRPRKPVQIVGGAFGVRVARQIGIAARAYIIEKSRIPHEAGMTALLADADARRRYLAV